MPVTFTTSVYDAQAESRANTSRNLAPNLVSNDVQFARASYTMIGTEAADDLIDIAILPAGIIPIPEMSSVTTGATATTADPTPTLTVDIGTAANPDGWADGIDVVAAGKVSCASTACAWLAETPLVADTGKGTAKVYATMATMLDATVAGAKLHFVLAYKRGR